MKRQWLETAGRVGALRSAGAALVLAAALAGCTPIETGHGYLPPAAQMDALRPGVDTRASVAANLGRPAMVGVLADSDWFYVRSRYSQTGIWPPVEVSRDVLALRFDAEGRLSQVRRLSAEDARDVAITRRITDTGARPIGLLDQLSRNLGRVSGEQLLAQP